MAGEYLYPNGPEDQKHSQRRSGDRCYNLAAPGIWAFEFFEEYAYLNECPGSKAKRYLKTKKIAADLIESKKSNLRTCLSADRSVVIYFIQSAAKQRGILLNK